MVTSSVGVIESALARAASKDPQKVTPEIIKAFCQDRAQRKTKKVRELSLQVLEEKELRPLCADGCGSFLAGQCDGIFSQFCPERNI